MSDSFSCIEFPWVVCFKAQFIENNVVGNQKRYIELITYHYLSLVSTGILVFPYCYRRRFKRYPANKDIFFVNSCLLHGVTSDSQNIFKTVKTYILRNSSSVIPILFNYNLSFNSLKSRLGLSLSCCYWLLLEDYFLFLLLVCPLLKIKQRWNNLLFLF